MTEKNTKAVIRFLYHLLNTGILTGAAFLCCAEPLGLAEVTWWHMLVLFLSIAFFAFVRQLNRRRQMYVLILGIMFFVPLLVNLWVKKGEMLPRENAYTILAVLFLIAGIGSLLQLLMEKYFPMKIILAFALGGWLLYALFGQLQIPKAGVVLSLLYEVSVAVEWIQAGRKKVEGGYRQSFILWVMPFLMVYFCLLIFMPVSEKPFSWQWVKDIYTNVEEKLTIFMENLVHMNTEDMGTATSGFPEEGSLYSGITINNKQLIKIKANTGKDVSIYLAGIVSESFDGREWRSLDESRSQERLLDTLETVYALERYKGDTDEMYYRNAQMEVEYQYFHTRYLLAPAKIGEIKGKERGIACYPQGGSFVFDSNAGYGMQYQLSFVQLRMDRDKLCEFLQQNLTEDEEKWKEVTKWYADESISLAELYAYRESMREQYLPQTEIDPEVEEWLSQVTADAADDIDKLFYIESALADMVYNTNPGKLPETVTDGKSYLHYFLLDKKEGYCSYFATAFVLLARAEGFPARYVQGFCVPVGNARDTMIYSGMSHAWPEVYIEGKGWIGFEPTPGYGANRYITWEDNTNRRVNTSADMEEMTDPEELSADMEAVDESIQRHTRHTGSKDGQERWQQYVMRIVVLIIMVSILIFATDFMVEKHREKRRSLRERYQLAVLQNLQILGMLGYERRKEETYQELTERIRQTVTEEEIPVGFIETYEYYLYGTLEISELLLDACLQQRAKLFTLLKERAGKKYILYRMKLYLMKKSQKGQVS